MLVKTLNALGLSLVVGSLYITQYSPLPLQSPALYFLFTQVDKYIPSATQATLFTLIRYGAIAPYAPLNNTLMDKGFDQNGVLLYGLKKMGFKGVRVGPIAYLPPSKEQRSRGFGILNALVNVLSFRRKEIDQQKDMSNMSNMSNSLQIHIDLIPNSDVMEYAPYLIKKNIMNAVQKIKETVFDHTIQSLRLDCNFQNFIDLCQPTPQMQQLLISTIDSMHQSMPQLQLEVAVSQQFTTVIHHCIHTAAIHRIEIDKQSYTIDNHTLVGEQLSIVGWRDVVDYIIKKQ